MSETALAWLAAGSSIVGLVVVLVRLGIISGRFQQQIARLESDREEMLDEIRRALDQQETSLRRDLSALSDSLAGMRREQRENNVRLYERWERISERVTKLEAWRSANGREL